MADIFRDMLASQDVPLTNEQWQALWQEQLDASGSQIANQSNFAPWRRFIDSTITLPAMKTVDALAGQVLPNSFLQTATDDNVVDLMADEVDLSRHQASYCQGVLKLERDSGEGVAIVPAGQPISTPVLNGKVYSVKTDKEVNLSAGQLSQAVTVIATETGTAHNLPAGYYSVASIPGITRVTADANWITSPGTDKESNEALKLRIRDARSSVGQHHTDSVYRSIITRQFPEISTDHIWFEKNAPRGPGTANIYVMLAMGTLSSGLLANINAHLMDEGNHGVGDDVAVFAMPTQAENVVLDIWPSRYLSAAEKSQLSSDSEAFVRAAFRENTLYTPSLVWPMSTFGLSKLAAELHREFPAIGHLKFNLDDITSAMAVPVLASLTVNLHE